ncbi:MAG: sn-glycerol-3-phosphate ABC transporter ATP-binding protein UgpC [Phycisphaerae bacterium]|nr:sn-glycerol-3-phosphate ABC transporter ATP-binding protein UgpC [Phycisphaerae bacterium]
MTRVLLENISKVFDKQVTAVSDFKLEVADGEFMVIVGPSGSGKTTILRMIAGLEKATSGNIYIGDTLVNDVPPRNRDIAMVFQNYALYPHMNVYENIAFGLKMRKFSKEEINRRVKKVSVLLGIEHLLTRKPKALSGGQRQRVAVGRAIVRSPKVFLFDEPLSNLDTGLRGATRAELKALHHKLQITSIYVTHDQTEAMTLGDRICVMYNGIIQQTASPIEIYERPINKFVAGFFGSPSMNFFAGRVKFKGDIPCFLIGNDTITLPRRLKTVLADYSDREMVMGIRPESLSLCNFSNKVDNAIGAIVDIVEPLGNRVDIYLTNNTGTKFIANTDTHTKINVQDVLKVHIDPEKTHIFEHGEAGKNITLSDGTLQ